MNDYWLAEKLRREYHSRGESLRGVGAASTEELMKRAQSGRDPRQNVSEEAFSERLRNRDRTGNANKIHYGSYAAPRRSQSGYRGSQSGAENRSQARPMRDTSLAGRVRREEEEAPAEIRVAKKKMPLGYLVMLAVMTMMIMSILFSIAQIYQTTGTIDDLEHQLEALQTTATELELAIEEKNDIRVIEKIATDQLGMVKEDSVQRKYISLSEGERIDIIGEEADGESAGGLGTMLSSLFEAFGKFFEAFS